MAVLFVYFGLLVIVVGVVSTLRPLRRFGIGNRKRAAAVLALGVLILAFGATLPAGLIVVQNPALRLDDFAPAYQFNEVHTIEVDAPPELAYRAIKRVTAGEIRLFRTLTWIRSPRLGAGKESILAPPPDEPLLDVATRSGFLLLADLPPRELVFGTVDVGPPLHVDKPTPQDFMRFNRPGYAKVTLNFTVLPRAGGGSTVRTETRVYATNASARRRFAAYWRVIFPGSAIIRVMWLRAIKERAERHG